MTEMRETIPLMHSETQKCIKLVHLSVANGSSRICGRGPVPSRSRRLCKSLQTICDVPVLLLLKSFFSFFFAMKGSQSCH